VPTDTLASTRRVTTESASRLVALYAARWGLIGRRAPAVDWTFSVGLVAGLEHQGGAAWAVVLPLVNTGPGPLPGGEAHVQIRDVDKTPIPGFDGDPLLEIRVTVAHELGHCVVAEAVARTGGALTVPAEEHIVEAAAQALVRSEGTADARVMARAVTALPSALRARISASAGQRARGGTMDPDLVKQALDALEAGDGAKCAELLKGLIAAAASGGAAPSHTEADGDEAAKAAPPPQAPGAAGDATPMEGARVAARKESTVTDIETMRARKAALAELEEARAIKAELKSMVEDERPRKKQEIITGLRARIGVERAAPVEKDIMDAATYQAAQQLADVIAKSHGAARARSGIEHNAAEDTTRGTPPKGEATEKLVEEGFEEQWIERYRARLEEGGEEAGATMLRTGRAQLAKSRARKAKEAKAVGS